ncbi:MAG TPA: AbrB/MazE/SpoVT family DNA-binding domain-containing protein [Nitrososphaerales archaeon]|nr:AbrB/MazE/SpoVT family DNA-binding domain-containing protein [Nitrososphaerales archaeon]
MSSYGRVIRKVKQWGNSVAIILPPEYLKEHGIKIGDTMEITYDDFIHIKPLNMKELGVRLEAARDILNGSDSK